MTIDNGDGESFVYEVAAEESLSEGVVEAVASEAGYDAVPPADPEMEGVLEPLFSVVDPDALDSVFGGSDDGADAPRGEVTFDYHGYEVTVRSEGWIALRRADPPAGMASD